MAGFIRMCRTWIQEQGMCKIGPGQQWITVLDWCLQSEHQAAPEGQSCRCRMRLRARRTSTMGSVPWFWTYRIHPCQRSNRAGRFPQPSADRASQQVLATARDPWLNGATSVPTCSIWRSSRCRSFAPHSSLSSAVDAVCAASSAFVLTSSACKPAFTSCNLSIFAAATPFCVCDSRNCVSVATRCDSSACRRARRNASSECSPSSSPPAKGLHSRPTW